MCVLNVGVSHRLFWHVILNVCMTGQKHMCNTPISLFMCVWHASSILVCAIPHSYVWRDNSLGVTWQFTGHGNTFKTVLKVFWMCSECVCWLCCHVRWISYWTCIILNCMNVCIELYECVYWIVWMCVLNCMNVCIELYECVYYWFVWMCVLNCMNVCIEYVRVTQNILACHIECVYDMPKADV